jgi:hypothetical protein
MAMPWLKWIKGFSKRRHVVSIAGELKVDRRVVACACFEFWEWADDNTTDGKLPGVTVTFIDELVTLPGFAGALKNVDWLSEKDGLISIPRFSKNFGESARKRDKAARRQSKHRAKPVTLLSRSKCDKSVTRPDKIRGDKNGNGILINLSMEELKQPAALLARYKHCTAAGLPSLARAPEAALLRFFAAAERAIELEADPDIASPCGLFRDLIIGGRWDLISNGQEDRARRKLLQLDRAQGGPRLAAT